MVACLEMYTCEIEDVPQVILELSDEILRKSYDFSVWGRFMGSEMVNRRPSYDTHGLGGGTGISAHLYRIRRS